MRRLHGMVAVLASGCLALALGACMAGEKPADTAAPASVPASELVQKTPEEVLAGLGADARVVALSRSTGELWMLAGGHLVGVTEDALNLDTDAVAMGALEELELEQVLALDPDLVIADATVDIPQAIADGLAEAGVPVLAPQILSFDDYAAEMAQLTEATDRSDLYEQNVENVRSKIDDVLAHAAKPERGSYVVLGVGESESAALGADACVACGMLEELGLTSTGDQFAGLEDVTLEQLREADPDWLFVLYEEDVSAGQKAFEERFESDDAWGDLAAVKAGHVVALPGELFAVAPNARWAEAYAYLSQVLHGAWA